MSKAMIDIGVRVNMAEAEKLEALPESIQARWEEVSKTLQGVSGLTGTARERVFRGSERMSDLLGKAETQGGFTPAQRREFAQSFKETTRIIDRGFTEHIATAKNKGKLLEHKLSSVGERLNRAKGKEKEALQKIFTQRFKEFGDFQAKGRDKGAVADAHTARTRFRGATQEAEDFGALVPNVQPPDEGQSLSEKKHRVGGMRFLTQFGRGMLGASVIGGGGYLAAAAVRIHGQTAPHPGVRLALLPDVQMRDYPRGATVAIPRPKALRLEAENRDYRV